MKISKRNALAAGALCAAVIGASSVAWAAGFWGNWPVVGGTGNPATITGLENVPMDTNIPGGAQPQSQVATTATLNQGAFVTASNATSFTGTAAQFWSSQRSNLLLTGAPSTAQTLTTPTAAAIIAGLPSGAAVGYTWTLHIVNVGGTASGVWTVSGGTGVTVTGNATVAVAGSRTYQATYATATTVTLQDIGN